MPSTWSYLIQISFHLLSHIHLSKDLETLRRKDGEEKEELFFILLAVLFSPNTLLPIATPSTHRSTRNQPLSSTQPLIHLHLYRQPFSKPPPSWAHYTNPKPLGLSMPARLRTVDRSLLQEALWSSKWRKRLNKKRLRRDITPKEKDFDPAGMTQGKIGKRKKKKGLIAASDKGKKEENQKRKGRKKGRRRMKNQ